jgi:metal-sulfur cluster biosynthetic enzyme
MTGLEAVVWAALDEVRDPELDEPITVLGFVASCQVGPAGAVSVRLRVPTYFCAPNFVFMMVADSRDAIGRVPGVTTVDVGVDGHFDAERINDGTAERQSFVETFGELAADELDRLRVDFLRKAVLAATDRVCHRLRAAGYTTTQVATMTLADVADRGDDDDVRRLCDRRAQLGIAVDAHAPLLIDPATGTGVADDAVAMHLHRARLTRISMETNGEICRGLLHERYAPTPVAIRVAAK